MSSGWTSAAYFSKLHRWTDGQRQGIISGQHYWQGWHPLQRRENEHFSKRTDAAGIVWLRVPGHAAMDYDSAGSHDGRDRRAGHRRLQRADEDQPGPVGAAETEQDPDRAARPGEYTHRGLEKQDGNHEAENRLDAVRAGAGQEPRRIDPQRAAKLRREADRAAAAGAKREGRENR